jgi:HPt (histidine-containing phosphotransfer) domain-containing protein
MYFFLHEIFSCDTMNRYIGFHDENLLKECPRYPVKEQYVMLRSAISIMFTVAILTAGASTYFLYQKVIAREKDHLLEVALRLATIIDASHATFLAEHPDNVTPSDGEGLIGSLSTSLNRAYHSGQNPLAIPAIDYMYSIGRINEDNFINFVVYPESGKQSSVSFQKVKTEPMGKALSGETGTMITEDAQCRPIVAAYAPISMLKWGLVATVYLKDIQGAFVSATLLSVVAACLLVVGGGLLMLRSLTNLNKIDHVRPESGNVNHEKNTILATMDPEIRPSASVNESSNLPGLDRSNNPAPHAAIANSGPPLDYQRFIKDMCYNNKDLAVKLITMLIDERGPQLLGTLSEAVNKRDEVAISTICHTLKGTAANMCADSLSAKAAAFSQIAKNGESSRYAGLLADLTESFDAIVLWWQSQDNGRS